MEPTVRKKVATCKGLSEKAFLRQIESFQKNGNGIMKFKIIMNYYTLNGRPYERIIEAPIIKAEKNAEGLWEMIIKAPVVMGKENNYDAYPDWHKFEHNMMYDSQTRNGEMWLRFVTDDTSLPPLGVKMAQYLKIASMFKEARESGAGLLQLTDVIEQEFGSLETTLELFQSLNTELAMTIYLGEEALKVA